MRRFSLLAISVAIMLIPTLHSDPAFAAKGIPCSYFIYQDDAQQALDDLKSNYPTLSTESLDPDSNGVACEDLPAKPLVLNDAEMVRVPTSNTFQQTKDLAGTGLSPLDLPRAPAGAGDALINMTGIDHYWVTLLGVRTRASGASCAGDYVAAVTALFTPDPEAAAARTFFLGFEPDRSPKIIPGFDVKLVAGWVWSIDDDPQQPLLLNEALVRQGILAADTEGLVSPEAALVEAAQEAAKQDKVGIWDPSRQQAPEVSPPDQPTAKPATGSIMFSGEASQVTDVFTITEGGQYKLAMQLGMGDAGAVVAVMAITGEQMFFTSGEPGQHVSTVGALPAGQYYIQVTGYCPWEVTLEPLT